MKNNKINKTIIISLLIGASMARNLIAVDNETMPFPHAMQMARQMVINQLGFENNSLMATIATTLRSHIDRNKIPTKVVFEIVQNEVGYFIAQQKRIVQEKQDFESAMEASKKEHESSSPKKKDDIDDDLERAIAMSLETNNNNSDEEQVKNDEEQERQDRLLAEAIAEEETKNKSTKRHTPPRPPEAGNKNNENIELVHLAEMIDRQHESHDQTYGALYILPEELQQLPLVHLKSLQQPYNEDITCGSRAAINAWAIQVLLEENKPLTAQAIQEKAAERNSAIKYRQLDSTEVYSFAVELGINEPEINMHILSDIAEIEHSQETINEHIKTLKAKDQWLLHFVCYTHRHWVLISFVKQRDKDPIMFYLNSKNAPLTPEYLGFTYIQKFYTQFKDLS